MTTDALWSVQEVKTQAEQVPGQVDIWEAIRDICTCDEPPHALSISPCPVHGGAS